MSALVDDDLVTTAFIDFLKARFATLPGDPKVDIGEAEPPASAEVARFIEVAQLLDGEEPSGGWAQPLAVRGLKYQLRSVGRTRREATWVMARTMEFIFEYADTPGGGHAYDIAVPKHVVIYRQMVSNIGYVTSGRSGGHLVHVRLRVQRTEA